MDGVTGAANRKVIPTWWVARKGLGTLVFWGPADTNGSRPAGSNAMMQKKPSLAEQIARAASAFETVRTGNTPKSVSVVMAENTLVITLHGALSAAEQALARSPEGAAQVQEFHRQLFANASDSLRQEIKRITGVEVREATAEIEPATGTVVGVFTNGTTVQVYLLAQPVVSESWMGNGSGDKSTQTEDL